MTTEPKMYEATIPDEPMSPRVRVQTPGGAIYMRNHVTGLWVTEAESYGHAWSRLVTKRGPLTDVTPQPRTWPTPDEPGPEVTHVKDVGDDVWKHVDNGWAIVRPYRATGLSYDWAGGPCRGMPLTDVSDEFVTGKPADVRMFPASGVDSFTLGHGPREFNIGDVEPGMAVRAVRDRDGDVWTRRSSGWGPGDEDWEYVLRYAPLTDITKE